MSLRWNVANREEAVKRFTNDVVLKAEELFEHDNPGISLWEYQFREFRPDYLYRAYNLVNPIIVEVHRPNQE